MDSNGSMNGHIADHTQSNVNYDICQKILMEFVQFT